jgi:hypothetical protein
VAQAGRFAVLTGDIVSSSSFKGKGENRVLAWILTAEKALKVGLPGAFHAGIDIFRGDSWQLVLRDPGSSLRAVLLFRSIMLSAAGIDSRVSVGFGTVEYLPQENVSTGTGEAFTFSGMGLTAMSGPSRMTLEFPPQNRNSLTRALNVITSLIDLQVQSWTRKQAAAVSGALTGLTQQQIADSWSGGAISQQAVSQHLENAGWSRIEDSLDYFEAALPEILSGSD